MEITAGLRDLLIETAESLSGAERRRFMANTLNKLQLGQRQAACLFGWGRDTLRKACHEIRTGLTCADAFCLRGRKPIEFHLYSGPQKVDHSGHLHLLKLFPFQPP